LKRADKIINRYSKVKGIYSYEEAYGRPIDDMRARVKSNGLKDNGAA
jgi:hypothetical protein